MNADSFESRKFPKSRLATLDVGKYGKDKHYMFGLLEVDVTAARKAARQMRQAGQGISFTAWMIKAIASAVARHKEVHAVAAGRRRVIMFNDVDIALPVERVVEGERAPLPILIKQANVRTVQDIHNEIEGAMKQDVSDESKYILGEHGFTTLAMKLYYALPQAIRLLTWKIMFGNPGRARRLSGTVTVTTVGSSGKTVGWILPTRSMHNLHISLGPITRKPKVVGSEIVVRNIMCLTVAFNHDVIDGVPARRFIDDLINHVEKGSLD